MAKSLLAAFLAKDEVQNDVLPGSVSLRPYINVSGFSSGISLTFTIGTDRQYVVKNVASC
jgi:hypothetical protein